MVSDIISRRPSGPSFQDWVVAVEVESEKLPEDERNKFKGDALELFSEFFLRVSVTDNRLGISGYTTVVGDNEDFGVDAHGENAAGVRTVIQCKYRSQPYAEIEYAALARTFTQGVREYGLDPKGSKNIWLVTTCRGANHYAHEVLGDMLHVIGFDYLSDRTSGNIAFWESFRESLTRS